MIEVSEQLSEFTYGYGATREIETLIANRNLRIVPYLPNLRKEAKLGFDVSFKGPGFVILLQFKLGQELKVFRRTSLTHTRPELERPFWRYTVDLDSSQFNRLLSYQDPGAIVCYMAPRFASWQSHEEAFRKRNIINRSLLVEPIEILRGAQPDSAGRHRVVYDLHRAYVCSEAIQIRELKLNEIVQRAFDACEDERNLLEDTIISLYETFKMRSNRLDTTYVNIKKRELLERNRSTTDKDPDIIPILSPHSLTGIGYQDLDEVASMAVVLATEAWLQGAEFMIVTPATNKSHSSLHLSERQSR